MNLFFTPATCKEVHELESILAVSDFHGEMQFLLGRYTFSFEEEEETIDQLEMDLTVMLDNNNINGHFEVEL